MSTNGRNFKRDSLLFLCPASLPALLLAVPVSVAGGAPVWLCSPLAQELSVSLSASPQDASFHETAIKEGNRGNPS